MVRPECGAKHGKLHDGEGTGFAMKRKRLGEVLREKKRITEEDLQSVMDEQQAKSVLLGEPLLERER
jgi:hypothetical protein